ncbi:hypothetical protein [Streptomyces sp. NPDC058683]|uniref:hypothetical protein n=1 Tax=Streptomyces sp. NPDC058683 TaxID=3346597 RepID=UPI003667BB10
MPQVALDARDVPLAGGDEPGEAAQGADDSATTGGTEETGGTGATGAIGGTGATGATGGTGATGVTEVLRVGALRDPWGVVPGDAARTVPADAEDPFSVRDPDRVPAPDDVGAVRIRPTGAAEVSDAPVFVDASGRRSRRFRRIGMAVGLACAVYAVVIVVTLLSGSSDAPWLPVPGQNHDRPAGRVDDSPQPARSARSSDDGASVAGPAVSGDGTTPSARASSRTPGAGPKGAGRPSASASAGPTSSAGTTGSSPKPGSSSVSPSPSSPAPTSDAPSPPASSPPPSPSDSAAPTGGPVAEGAAPRTGTGTSPAPVL